MGWSELVNATMTVPSTGRHMQVAYNKLQRHIGCSNRWMCAVSCSHTLTSARKLVVDIAGVCPSNRAQHGPVGTGCLCQAPSPYRILKLRGCAQYLAQSHTPTPNHPSAMFNSKIARNGSSLKMTKRAGKARSNWCRLHLVSTIAIWDAATVWICAVSCLTNLRPSN